MIIIAYNSYPRFLTKNFKLEQIQEELQKDNSLEDDEIEDLTEDFEQRSQTRVLSILTNKNQTKLTLNIELANFLQNLECKKIIVTNYQNTDEIKNLLKDYDFEIFSLSNVHHP